MSTDSQIICPYCHDTIRDPAMVLCLRCETPHHEECFIEHKRCTQLYCESKRALPLERPRISRPALPLPKKLSSFTKASLSIIVGVLLSLPLHGLFRVRTCGHSHGAEPAQIEEARSQRQALELAFKASQEEELGHDHH